MDCGCYALHPEQTELTQGQYLQYSWPGCGYIMSGPQTQPARKGLGEKKPCLEVS